MREGRQGARACVCVCTCVTERARARWAAGTHTTQTTVLNNPLEKESAVRIAILYGGLAPHGCSRLGSASASIPKEDTDEDMGSTWLPLAPHHRLEPKRAALICRTATRTDDRPTRQTHTHPQQHQQHTTHDSRPAASPHTRPSRRLRCTAARALSFSLSLGCFALRSFTTCAHAG